MSNKKKDPSKGNGKLKSKDYERELARLHVELVKLQQWVVHKGLKICVVFEGRDGAGKGGTIKAITERVSPRIRRLCAGGNRIRTIGSAGEGPDASCVGSLSLRLFGWRGTNQRRH